MTRSQASRHRLLLTLMLTVLLGDLGSYSLGIKDASPRTTPNDPKLCRVIFWAVVQESPMGLKTQTLPVGLEPTTDRLEGGCSIH
jgi:hypothetical protein